MSRRRRIALVPCLWASLWLLLAGAPAFAQAHPRSATVPSNLDAKLLSIVDGCGPVVYLESRDPFDHKILTAFVAEHPGANVQVIGAGYHPDLGQACQVRVTWRTAYQAWVVHAIGDCTAPPPPVAPPPAPTPAPEATTEVAAEIEAPAAAAGFDRDLGPHFSPPGAPMHLQAPPQPIAGLAQPQMDPRTHRLAAAWHERWRLYEGKVYPVRPSGLGTDRPVRVLDVAAELGDTATRAQLAGVEHRLTMRAVIGRPALGMLLAGGALTALSIAIPNSYQSATGLKTAGIAIGVNAALLGGILLAVVAKKKALYGRYAYDTATWYDENTLGAAVRLHNERVARARPATRPAAPLAAR